MSNWTLATTPPTEDDLFLVTAAEPITLADGSTSVCYEPYVACYKKSSGEWIAYDELGNTIQNVSHYQKIVLPDEES